MPKKNDNAKRQVGTRWEKPELDEIYKHAEKTKDSFNGVVSKAVGIGLPIIKMPEYWTARLGSNATDEAITETIRLALDREYGKK